MYDFALVFSLLHALDAPPMALTREQLASIAALARLELTAGEIPLYQESLSRILDFVGALERCETGAITPLAHPLPGLSQRLRADAVSEADHHLEYQANAPLTGGGLYLVPKVIE